MPASEPVAPNPASPDSEPSDLESQLSWLFARQRFGVKPGLARVEALLARLGEPQRQFDAVLVGGTNGKGSCSSTLAGILSASGRRTGLFTSPHLTRFGERFVVDGDQLADAELLRGLITLRPHAEALEATFFEIVTALACLLFARSEVDLAVMEVGLGGRLDATNVLTPCLSVITGIARDHTEILGTTVAEIAAEKAGIMRAATPTLTGATGAALGVLKETAHSLGAPLLALGEDIVLQARDLGWSGVRCEIRSLLEPLVVTTPLLGLHQGRNVALAAVAAQLLGAPPEAVRQGVARPRWPGRLEPVRFRERTFLLDGAHNPEAARALAAAVQRLGAVPVKFIFGVAADKAVAEIIGALEPVVSEVILTRARLSPRAASPAALAPYWNVPTAVTDTPEAALELAYTHTVSGEVVVVAGSLYLIGEIRPVLLEATQEVWERYQ
jgi:dihydrofolate synthase/folylpolyglutamate synthase